MISFWNFQTFYERQAKEKIISAFFRSDWPLVLICCRPSAKERNTDLKASFWNIAEGIDDKDGVLENRMKIF